MKYVGVIVLVFLCVSFASASLVLRVSDISPSSIGPDDDFTVGIQIENQGDNYAEDILLEVVDLGEDIQLKENRTLSFNRLRNMGGIESVVYHFHTSRDAIDGDRSIGLKLSWKDEGISAEFESDYNIEMSILAKGPEVSLSGVKTDPEIIYPGDDVILTVKLENGGSGDAGSVRVLLTDLDFEGVKEAYLGKIDSGESMLGRFPLKVTDSGLRIFTLRVVYEFGGKEMFLEFPVTINVFSKRNLLPWIGGGLFVLVLVGYLLRRRYKIKIIEKDDK